MKIIRYRKNLEKQFKLLGVISFFALITEITGLVLGFETRIITVGFIILITALLFFRIADMGGYFKKKSHPADPKKFSIFLDPGEFRERTDFLLRQARRYSHEFSIICIGIRGIDSILDKKRTNILKGVEYSLNSILRESDFLTHDSSGIIYACLPMTNERHKLTAVAEKIIQSLNSYFYIASYRTNIKSNIGIAIYPHSSSETEKLIHAAENAMEESVSMGGNTFCFHI